MFLIFEGECEKNTTYQALASELDMASRARQWCVLWRAYSTKGVLGRAKNVQPGSMTKFFVISLTLLSTSDKRETLDVYRESRIPVGSSLLGSN